MILGLKQLPNVEPLRMPASQTTPQGSGTGRKGTLRVYGEDFGWATLKNDGSGTMHFNISLHQFQT